MPETRQELRRQQPWQHGDKLRRLPFSPESSAVATGLSVTTASLALAAATLAAAAHFPSALAACPV